MPCLTTADAPRRARAVAAAVAALTVAAPLTLLGAGPAAGYTGTAEESKAGYLTQQQMCDALKTAGFENCYLWNRPEQWIGPRQNINPPTVSGQFVSWLGPYPAGDPLPLTLPSMFVYQTIVSVDAFRTSAAARQAFADLPSRLVTGQDIVEQTSDVIVVKWSGTQNYRPSEFRILAYRVAGDALVSGQCDTGTDATWDGVTAEAGVARGADCAKIIAAAQQTNWETVAPTLTQEPQAAATQVQATFLTLTQTRALLGKRASKTATTSSAPVSLTKQWALAPISNGVWQVAGQWKVTRTKTVPFTIRTTIYQSGIEQDAVTQATKTCGMAATATTATNATKRMACVRTGPTLVTVTVTRNGPPLTTALTIARQQAAKTAAAAVPIT